MCIPEQNAVEAGMRVFIAVCLSIIIAGSFLGNLLVCVAFKVNKQLRIVSNYFILNLAISDLITTVFVMPFDLDVIVKRRWTHGAPMCEFFTSMYLISAPASILNLLAVSIDRFRLISDPFAYERTMTPSRALIIIGIVWVYAIMMALMPIMGWRETWSTENCSIEAPMCYFPIPFTYSIMISVLHFVIPPLVMTVIYFKIYKIAWSHAQKINHRHSMTSAVISTNVDDGARRTSRLSTLFHVDINLIKKHTNGAERSAQPALQQNVKAAKSLAIIVGAFFACWYPLTLTSLIVNACGGLQGNCYVPPSYVFDILITIGYLNSMLNPFLYALHNKKFKKTYKWILRYLLTRLTGAAG